MGNIVIVGASRGLGASLAAGLPKAGDEVWCISRTRPDVLDRPDAIRRTWVQCDLSDPVNTGAVKKILMDTPVDLFIYNAAIWDKHTFSGLKDAEVVAIIHVNLTSLLIALRDLFPNIAASGNGKVVLIGSTSGLENEGARLVVYPATKFAMRGAAHALRKLFRPVGVPVTVISPGSMATDVPFDAGREEALERHGGSRIPVHDLVSIVSMIRLLSPASCVKELHLPALQDTDV